MAYNETMQWLIDNKVECKFLAVDGTLCLYLIMEDPHGGEDLYTAFRFKESSFTQEYLSPAVEALKKSVDG